MKKIWCIITSDTQADSTLNSKQKNVKTLDI